jgi:predicted ATPase/signal transduction histidine kinase
MAQYSNQPAAIPMVPGFVELYAIHLGRRYAVFRARRASDGLAVVIKLPITGSPSANDQLHSEHELLVRLGLPGIVRPVALASVGPVLALVLEDAGPEDLAHWLRRHQPPLSLSLSFAIQIASTLARLHDRGVIHRDLNPSNLVLADDRLTLVDFESATSLGAAAAGVPAELENTLAYIAPEQTGRMNRLVDHRADLYSLGVTLYQLFTGVAPFVGHDPLELVHAHLARAPLPPIQQHPALPNVLSQLVLKLLAKMPEQRYQSAEAVLADLQHAYRLLAETGVVSDFELGLVDATSGLPLPERLYGRQRERARLEEALASAAAGGRELVLLSGASGVGKSTLVEELADSVKARHGHFVIAKSDLRSSGAPYTSLIDGFRDVIAKLVAERSPQLGELRDRLLAEIGPNGRILTELIPELERVIGIESPVPEVPPAQNENRFRLAFHSFVRALATAAHPLVVFADDLQWADLASQSLLRILATTVELPHFLLVVAFRPDEIDAVETAARTLEALAHANARVTTIKLDTLDLAAITELCCDGLRCDPSDGRKLAEVLLRKTGGNAFFIKRLLRHMHQAKLLHFDAAAQRWRWDLNAVATLEVTDNVADLLAATLRALPTGTQRVLTIAACFGKRVTLSQIAAVTEEPLEAVAASLWTAVREGLLVALEPLQSLETGPLYQFAHDRVQQAAYVLVPLGERQELHRRIGKHLLAQLGEGAPGDRIFEIGSHLNLAADRMSDPAERMDLIALNARAAQRARSSSAYGTAVALLEQAIRLLPDDAWQSTRDLAFSLHRDLVECCFVSGNAESGEAWFARTSERARSPLEQASLCNIRVVAATLAGDFPRAMGWGVKGLGLLGLELPSDDVLDAVTREIADIATTLGERSIERLIDSEAMTRPAELLCMQILSNLLAPTYMGKPSLYDFVVTRMVSLSLRHGNAVQSPFAYAAFGLVTLSRNRDYERGHAWGRLGVELSRRTRDPVAQCRAIGLFGTYVNSWRAPLATSVTLLREAIRIGLQSGELQYGNYWGLGLARHLFFQGVELPRYMAEVDQLVAVGRRTNMTAGMHWQLTFRQATRCLQGRTRAHSFDDDEFDEHKYLASVKLEPYALSLYRVIRLQVHYLLGELREARRLSVQLADSIVFQRSTFGIVDYHFYSALTLAAQCPMMPDDTREALLAEIEAHARPLAEWAANCPENFAHRHLVVMAELQRLRGDTSAAAMRYDQALEAATRGRFLRDEALASELAGRFFAGMSRRHIAGLYLANARHAYERWGADAKVQALEREFPTLLSPASPQGQLGGVAALDLHGILQAAEAISSEVVLDRLLETLMEVCLAAAGAERGALVLRERDQLMVRILSAVAQPARLMRVHLEACDDVPASLIRRAATTGDPLVIDDAAHQGQFTNDPYVARHGVRSALVQPIKKQSQLVGLLYLENNLATRMFVPERLRLLLLLSSQMAVSLENSLLFEDVVTAVRMRDEFLSVASHELNTPMTSLTLSVQQLIEMVKEGEVRGESLLPLARLAERQTRKLTQLISDLLDATRFSAKQLVPRLREVELGALVRDVVERFAPELQRVGSSVHIHASELVRGRWDGVRLEQVVLNLLSNAAKFGPGKPIDITVERVDERARLTVHDRGIGIDPDRRGRIFDRFERAVSARQYGGLGLGLYICRSIVSAHGGTIAVESTSAQGSTFVVELPLNPPMLDA